MTNSNPSPDEIAEFVRQRIPDADRPFIFLFYPSQKTWEGYPATAVTSVIAGISSLVGISDPSITPLVEFMWGGVVVIWFIEHITQPEDT